jgi:hypothetical protein
MKKYLATAIALITLSACGTKTVVVEKSPDTTKSPVVTNPPMSSEDIYIENVLSEYPGLLNKFGRQWIIDYATTTCDSIDQGMTLTDLLNMTTASGVDASMIGFLTGEAIRNFCPRNQWFIDAATNA